MIDLVPFLAFLEMDICHSSLGRFALLQSLRMYAITSESFSEREREGMRDRLVAPGGSASFY